MMGDTTRPGQKRPGEDERTAGDRPGTRTVAKAYNREETTHTDGQPNHGKFSDDPDAVFEARHKSPREGDCNLAILKKASQVSRTMGKRGGRI
jgi:hypothetical protein